MQNLQPEYQVQRIGDIDNGIDGIEVYYQIKRLDDDLIPAEVVDYLAPHYRWGSESDHPNALTCNRIQTHQTKSNQCIAVVSLGYNN